MVESREVVCAGLFTGRPACTLAGIRAGTLAGTLEGTIATILAEGPACTLIALTPLAASPMAASQLAPSPLAPSPLAPTLADTLAGALAELAELTQLAGSLTRSQAFSLTR